MALFPSGARMLLAGLLRRLAGPGVDLRCRDVDMTPPDVPALAADYDIVVTHRDERPRPAPAVTVHRRAAAARTAGRGAAPAAPARPAAPAAARRAGRRAVDQRGRRLAGRRRAALDRGADRDDAADRPADQRLLGHRGAGGRGHGHRAAAALLDRRPRRPPPGSPPGGRGTRCAGRRGGAAHEHRRTARRCGRCSTHCAPRPTPRSTRAPERAPVPVRARRRPGRVPRATGRDAHRAQGQDPDDHVRRADHLLRGAPGQLQVLLVREEAERCDEERHRPAPRSPRPTRATAAGAPPPRRPAAPARPTPSGATRTSATPAARTRPRSTSASGRRRGGSPARRARAAPTRQQQPADRAGRAVDARRGPARPGTVWLVKNGEPLTPAAGLSSQNVQDDAGATRNPSPVATAPVTHRGDRGPVVAAQQEVQHEHRGGQLDRRGDADQQPARPARCDDQAVDARPAP